MTAPHSTEPRTVATTVRYESSVSIRTTFTIVGVTFIAEVVEGFRCKSSMPSDNC